MVKLLGVPIVQVAVPLSLVNPGYDVDILKPCYIREVNDRFYDAEFVEVARSDDVGVGVLGEDVGDESLHAFFFFSLC